VSSDGWTAISVRAFIGDGLTALIAFLAWEFRRDEPLLDVRLFLNPLFLNANIVGWVSTIALFGAEFMLPLYLQNLRGLSALDTGLLLMPQGLAVAVAGPICGRLVDKIGARWIVLVGFALLSFNTYQLSQITLNTSFDELRLLLVVRGIALGCTMQPTQLTAMSAVAPRLRTNASSLNNAMRNVFQSFGIAMLSTVVTTQTIVHSTVLSWDVRPETMPGQLLPTLSAMLQQTQGVASTAADQLAVMIVLGQIGQRAAVLAFGDAYRITFFAALLALALASLLPGRLKVDPTSMAGGH
jgi:DHA2 family multidrug resistance protein